MTNRLFMLQFRVLSPCLSLCFKAFRSLFLAVPLISISFSALAVPGQLDPTFGNGGITRSNIANSDDVANAIAQQPDGDWIVAGSCYFASPTRSYRPCLRRYSSSGVQDVSFGTNGVVVLAVSGLGHAFAMVVRPDGRIVTAGLCGSDSSLANTDACVVQYLPSGSVDPSFGINGQLKIGNGWAYAVALQNDGKIVAAGSCGGFRFTNGYLVTPFDFCVWRVTLTGTMDAAFGSSGAVRVDFDGKDDAASSLAITASGAIVVSGSCAEPVQAPTYSVFCGLKLNPDGQLDASFASSGKFALNPVGGVEGAQAIRIQPDSKILMAGRCEGNQWCVARLTTAGVLDSTFAQGGVFRDASFTGAAADLVIQLDGRLLVVGACVSKAPTCLIRLNENGTLDGNYGAGGVTTLAIGGSSAPSGFGASSLALQLDGKALVAATCTLAQNEFCIARLDGEPYGAATCTLNVEANQTIEPGTDAVLIVRYILGFRGVALTKDALGAYPSRNQQALEGYLGTLNLDADGDGQVHAMTDGLLILRAMLGLSGNALTSGAVNTSSPNVRNAQQILTWIETTHGMACLPSRFAG